MKNLIIWDDLWYIITFNDDQVLVENEEILSCKMQRLLAMINILLKDEVIPYILEIDDLKDVWNKLEKLFATTTQTKRLLIRNWLYNTRVEEGGNVFEYLIIIQDFNKQQIVMGDLIRNKDIVVGMLNVLLESYESFVQTIINRTKFPTMDEFKNCLQHEEMRKELKGLKWT